MMLQPSRSFAQGGNYDAEATGCEAAECYTDFSAPEPRYHVMPPEEVVRVGARARREILRAPAAGQTVYVSYLYHSGTVSP